MIAISALLTGAIRRCGDGALCMVFSAGIPLRPFEQAHPRCHPGAPRTRRSSAGLPPSLRHTPGTSLAVGGTRSGVASSVLLAPSDSGAPPIVSSSVGVVKSIAGPVAMVESAPIAATKQRSLAVSARALKNL